MFTDIIVDGRGLSGTENPDSGNRTVLTGREDELTLSSYSN
jgi:hypothetical protein